MPLQFLSSNHSHHSLLISKVLLYVHLLMRMVCSTVLVNCAAQTLPTDLTLGLGFLLSIPKVGLVIKVYINIYVTLLKFWYASMVFTLKLPMREA